MPKEINLRIELNMRKTKSTQKPLGMTVNSVLPFFQHIKITKIVEMPLS
jgi:hypothetical protein